MPDVSVVMSTYNRVGMLGDSLRSVLAQEGVDLEVVVVDNGSSDATAEYLASVADPRLRVVRNEESLGPTGGRNSGLAVATGTYVGFCDDDDLWAPDKLRRQLDAMQEAGATWSYTGCVYIDAADVVIGGEPPLSPDEIMRRLPRRYRVPGGISSMLWRREALDGDGLLDPDLVWATDWDLALRLARTGPPAGVIAPLVGYRQHGTNVSKGAARQEHELDLIVRKHGDVQPEGGIDLGAQYRFIGSEALRAGKRIPAIVAYVRAVVAGDLGSLVRMLGVLAPTWLHPWLRRTMLSDRAWLAQGRTWLDARPRRRRVVIAQARIPQYRVPLYDLLAARLRAEGVDLQLVHSNGSATDGRGDATSPPGSIEVPSREVTVGGRRLVWTPLLPVTRGADLVVVEQATKHLVNFLLLFRARLLGGPAVALWGHGRSWKSSSSRVAEAVKRWLTRSVHWFFAYTGDGAAMVVEDGVDVDRVTVVQNATDTKALRADRASVTEADRARTLGELGLRGGQVALFVGGHVAFKRLDLVMGAMEAAHAALPTMEAIFVGDGPSRPDVEAWAVDRRWATHAGRRFGPDLARVAACADVIVAPAAAGLVVVDAFALGLPVMVSRDLDHGPEASYIVDGVNGRWVADGGDMGEFGREVAALLRDRDALDRLADGARASADEHNLEQMVARFAEGVLGALRRLP